MCLEISTSAGGPNSPSLLSLQQCSRHPTKYTTLAVNLKLHTTGRHLTAIRCVPAARNRTAAILSENTQCRVFDSVWVPEDILSRKQDPPARGGRRRRISFSLRPWSLSFLERFIRHGRISASGCECPLEQGQEQNPTDRHRGFSCKRSSFQGSQYIFDSWNKI